MQWNLGSKEETSFEHLKVALASAPVMRLPDFERYFVVTTDVSDGAVKAILEQNFGQRLQLVAFVSRKLDNAKTPYSSYEREIHGIVWALG